MVDGAAVGVWTSTRDCGLPQGPPLRRGTGVGAGSPSDARRYRLARDGGHDLMPLRGRMGVGACRRAFVRVRKPCTLLCLKPCSLLCLPLAKAAGFWYNFLNQHARSSG